MKLERVLQLLEINKQKLEQMGVKTLAVFGSTARQEAKLSSDVDILVAFNSSPTFDQYIELKFFLEDVLGREVDLVTQDGLKPLVQVEIEKEAIYVP